MSKKAVQREKNESRMKNHTPLYYSIDGRFRGPRPIQRGLSANKISLESRTDKHVPPAVSFIHKTTVRKPEIILGRTFTNIPRYTRLELQNANYVYIKDPIIKDLTLGLINSEKERRAAKIDSNKLTLVEHKNHSLLLCKNGSDALTNRTFSTSNMGTYESRFNTRDEADENVELKHNPELYTNLNFILSFKNANYHLMEIFNESTGQLIDNPKTTDLNSETRRAIQSDLRDNPLKDFGGRSYKVVVYGNGISGKDKSHTLRLLVCSIERLRPKGTHLPFISDVERYERNRLGNIIRKTPAEYKFLDLDEII